MSDPSRESIDHAFVADVAQMAQLALSDDELSRMTEELKSILQHVQQLQSVNVEGVQPTTSGAAKLMPLREDQVRSSLPRGLVMDQAPDALDGCFVVPSFVDEG